MPRTKKYRGIVERKLRSGAKAYPNNKRVSHSKCRGEPCVRLQEAHVC